MQGLGIEMIKGSVRSRGVLGSFEEFRFFFNFWMISSCRDLRA